MNSASKLLHHNQEEHNNKVQQNTKTLFHTLQASTFDDFRIMSLIEAGCDPTATGERGETLLHILAKNNLVAVAHKLIEMGADVNARNHDNETPLHYAALSNNVEAACLLLYCGADVNVRSKSDDTALTNSFDPHSLYNLAFILTDYYDSDSALSMLIKCGYIKWMPVIHSLLTNMVVKGAPLPNLDANFSLLLQLSLVFPNAVLFKLVWTKINRRMSFGHFGWSPKQHLLEVYMKTCSFPKEQWLECLYLILNSPNLNKFAGGGEPLGQCRGGSRLCAGRLIRVLERACWKNNIEDEDRLALIYTCLSFDIAVLHRNCLELLYDIFGFSKDFEAVVYCSDYCDDNCCRCYRNENSPLVDFVCTTEKDPTVAEMLGYLDYKMVTLNCCIHFNSTECTRFLHLLGFFALPLQMKRDLLVCGYKGCNVPEIVAKFKAIPDVPSLAELSRDQVRSDLKREFSGKKLYQFYDAVRILDLPKTVADILYFKRPLY